MFDFLKKKPAHPTIPEAVTAPATEPEAATQVAPIIDTQPTPKPEPKQSWGERLKQSLSKTRKHLGNQLASLFGGGKIDAEVYEELETILITSDVGVNATKNLLADIKNRVKVQSLDDTVQLKAALKAAMSDLLTPLQKPLDTSGHKPFVIMLAGVNGAGKTTSIGKLAHAFQAEGKSVLIAAGDTFRAAAREQLQIWGERNNVHVVSQTSGDAAAVMFDAINSAIAKNIDIVLADTAGRLPTQMHLMDEIAKVKRVMDKALPGAPHEVLLVLDANTGQNAVTQVKTFDDALGVTGLVLSKLDGTAKGGVIAAIAEARPIPIRYIGIGEAIDDLRPFNASEFIDAMIDS
ncbi:signal recognition particle-docking protein FtsY [Methylotenera sp.]|uniref:signal recognition particle-docking protein FtsY n=1 Tax=Methylotenera sp. TaxID=2051956 RepID=UPI002724BA00|nr:signal recognition particle-docking protein FtsY [Methylotenera sp.]MDO9206132.1 signal recognition particle-docking protein FtsY [Methylotenera sp.]MDP1522972.1 signal recognition particle-docking protein FtsY [Methylotenera sp.]MDP2070928.1 signal recognition particle-docking protein FtsY [Methylotenera sp.]MDP2230282.1 signal recognition particle-docking protein FtsY [Methylotenera sp.]MDP3005802.1 signal recognition particle-docking protein FtsY [Methylotenera sp.]